MKTNDDYWKFAESERHFNETQAGIRNHTATWMLAAFAVISILLKSEDKVNWLVSPVVFVGRQRHHDAGTAFPFGIKDFVAMFEGMNKARARFAKSTEALHGDSENQ